MKFTYLWPTFLLVATMLRSAHAQLNNNTSGFTPIKYNFITKQTDKPIPFDQPFLLQVENIDARNITAFEVYETEYREGTRQLKTDNLDSRRRVSYPDFGKPVTGDKEKILLHFPALSPNKQFNVLLEGKLSVANLKRALNLNRLLRISALEYDGTGMISGPQNLIDVFWEFSDSTNNNPFNPRHLVNFITDVDQYYQEVYAPSLFNYIDLFSQNRYQTPNFPTATDIISLASNLPAKFNSYKDINHLQKALTENTVDAIYKGLLPINYKSSSMELTDPYNFDERILHLANSIQYFDTLYNIMNELLATGAALNSLTTTIKMTLDALVTNKGLIETNLKQIVANCNIAQEGRWLVGTTESKDLQTKGSSILTLDAGFTNIFARNMYNQVKYIPKLYWGLNIHFRAVDKNITLKELPKKITGTNEADSNIVARKNIFRRLSLMIGLTLGDMSNSQFGDFYNKSALLIGPSLRFAKAYRVGAGVALLRRTDDNPLKSQKKIIPGAYLSLSVDIDVLKAIDKITGILFK